MITPSRFVFSDSHIRINPITGTASEPFIIAAIDVPTEGSLMFQYAEMGKTHLVIMPTSLAVLEELNSMVPDDIFHPDLPATCSREFLRPETKLIRQISLSRVYADGTHLEETTLRWDGIHMFRDFPGALLKMVIDFGRVFGRLEDEIEAKFSQTVFGQLEDEIEAKFSQTVFGRLEDEIEAKSSQIVFGRLEDEIKAKSVK